ncbi:MAG TPA: hypothetical protein VGX22_15790 [Candidatus Dormibacteraeota bacterium]|nr:hypothetical protein [Candidatus Dormibacteraeota bacterium]
MNRPAANRQLDSAIEAFFAQRGMTHTSKQISLPGGRSMLGGITLDGYVSADGRWFAMYVPSSSPRYKVSISWQLMCAVPGVNLPSVAVSRKGAAGALVVPGRALTLESIDFDARFAVTAVDRRAAVMLIDQGMMAWLLECDRVNFLFQGNTLSAFVLPGEAAGGEVEQLEMLFHFCEGFVARMPEILSNEFPSA